MLTPNSRRGGKNWTWPAAALKRQRPHREEINRTRGGEGLPLEAINSVNLLVDARDEIIAALVGYDLAQFQLFVAIGETPNTALPDPLQVGTATNGKH